MSSSILEEYYLSNHEIFQRTLVNKEYLFDSSSSGTGWYTITFRYYPLSSNSSFSTGVHYDDVMNFMRNRRNRLLDELLD